MPLDIGSDNDQKIKVTAAPKTTSGRPAQVDGPLTVTVQSGDATAVQDPAEPLSFFAVSSDNPGTTVFQVDADADLGAGIVTISDIVTYTVAGAAAANVGLSASPAEPK
jgi:hypothetical protein